jgi:hypothetical protein
MKRSRFRADLLILFALLLCSAPAGAQVDFAGEWVPLFHEDYPERLPGPELGDYMGLPVNEAARLRGDSWDANRISIVSEYQCRPHGGDYSMRGLANLRIDSVLDPVTQQLVAWHTRINFQEMERTIWLDGRSRPGPNAAHTWQGFSTATWDVNMLNVYTTHLKENYLRRNGLARSAKATFREHWMRHGNYLTVVTAITDPVFLSEPLVRSQSWVLDPGQRIGRDVCEYAQEVPKRSADHVPHHLPGTNPYLHEVADEYGLPLEGVRGGAETLYPEYRLKMPKPDKSPLLCEHYCTCNNEQAPCEYAQPRPKGTRATPR